MRIEALKVIWINLGYYIYLNIWRLDKKSQEKNHEKKKKKKATDQK